MTDQRTVADIRKEHHDRYGTDISKFLVRQTSTTENDERSDQPISECEPNSDHEDLAGMENEDSARDPDSIA